MGTKKNLLAVSAVLVCCAVGLWLAASIQGSEKTYEIHPYISTSEYRTDAGRAIDAYERLMERYMDTAERNLRGIGANVRTIAKELNSVNAGLTDIRSRLARIEKALGIEQSKPLIAPQRKPAGKKACNKPLQSVVD